DSDGAGVSTEPAIRTDAGVRPPWAAGDVRPEQVITVGRLRVDTRRLEADLGRGRVPLTRLEFLFLQELLRHPGQSGSRRELLSAVWGCDLDPGSNVVGVCVRRLRAKLGDHLIT